PTEKIVIFPPGECMHVGFQRVKLGSATEPDRPELRRLEPDDEWNDSRWRLLFIEDGFDFRCAEDAEVENGLARRLDRALRVRLALGDVERSANRGFRQSVEPLDFYMTE